MRNRLIIPIVIFLLSLGSLLPAASQNYQKIIPLKSPVYTYMDVLYIDQGLALPSTARPWSVAEANYLLDRIHIETLSYSYRSIYEAIAKEIEPVEQIFDFSFPLSLETYIHANTDQFTQPDDWIRSYEQRLPMLDIILETWPGDAIYGYSSYGIVFPKYSDFDGDAGAISRHYGNEITSSNIIFFYMEGGGADIDFGVPYRAFGSFGGMNWSVQIGRDKVSWGPGETGNFIIGDHLTYHNQGRFTAYTKNFKYTLLTSFFPHPDLYYPILKEGEYDFARTHNDLLTGLRMFLGHRLEWRLFNNKFGFVLTEAIMYQSLDNYVDLSILNPSMVFHNLYIRQNANSIISIDMDYALTKGLNIYGQLVLDEFALPGEEFPGRDDNALPNGFGYMVGIKANKPHKEGFFHGSFEWVMTDPFLYLRDNGANSSVDHEYNSQDLGEYGVNWVVAIRRLYQNSKVIYEEEFLGYRYGGDAIVLNANLGYREIGKWSLGSNAFFMWHGTHDKWTLWSLVDKDDSGDNIANVTTPTNDHLPDNNGDPDAVNRDAVSHTFVGSAYGTYQLKSYLDLYGQLDFIWINNPGNRSDMNSITDVQFTLGMTWNL